MTRRLARLADFTYRRRRLMVLLWIVAAVVIIGLGSSLAGEYHADYNTPGSESKAASDLTKVATTTLPLNVPGWEVKKEQGEALIDAAEGNSGGGLEIKLGGEPIYLAQESTSPKGIGFLAAAIVLLIAFGSLVAAGLPLAIALIGIGVGIDYSLLVLTRFRTSLKSGKDRHDAVVEAVTTAGRSVLIAGSTVVIAVLGLFLTALPYMYGVAISASLAVLVVMLASINWWIPDWLERILPRIEVEAAAPEGASS